MPNANLASEYGEKNARFMAALKNEVPDRVPILLQSVSWAYAYSHTKINEVYYDPRKLYEAGTSYLKDIYTDAIFTACITAPIGLYTRLNAPRKQYIVSADGYSMQHVQIADMKPDEYPELTEDVSAFIANKLLPRRFPDLNEPYPKNLKTLKDAYDEIIYWMQTRLDCMHWAQEEYGVSILSQGGLYTPCDMLFDFFRGFKGLIMDMRKRPDDVIAAADALSEYVIAMNYGSAKPGDLKFVPLHVPTYINPKQFEKIYWPSFYKVIMAGIEKGVLPILYLENDWTPYLDYLLEFPKNSIAVMIEYGNMADIKKKLGGHMGIVGGMPCGVLRGETKEYCVDYTKNLLETMMPGGGYMFSTDRLLLSPGDINVENYKACAEVVREYGKYE